MTREEAEAVAARLVTVEPRRPPFVDQIIAVAGISVGCELHETGARRRAADLREAIVRALTGDDA